MRPPVPALLRTSDMLPSSTGQESVVSTYDEFCVVRENDAIRRLDRWPVVEYGRYLVSAILPVEDGAVDCIARLYVCQWLGPSIGHEDRGFTRAAVDTGMTAPAIHIDGPLERHAAGGGDPVQDGLGLDLLEGDVAELGAVEGAHRRRGVEQGQVGRGTGLASQVGEGLHPLTLERVFGRCKQVAGRCGNGSARGVGLWRRHGGCGSPLASVGRRSLAFGPIVTRRLQELEMSDLPIAVRVEGDERAVEAGATAGDLVGGDRAVVAARVNGVLRDLSHVVGEGDQVEPVTVGSEDGRMVMRHSTAHVLAQAVQDLFPEAKLGIGPPIENGFYYDFGVPKPFHPDDLERIDKRMQEIVKSGQRFRRRRFESVEQAKAELAAEPFKLELV